MVVLPLNFEITNETVPVVFEIENEFISVVFEEKTKPLELGIDVVDVVKDYKAIGLTDPEIELLNTILTDGTAISQPEMTATYTSGRETEPDPEDGWHWHFTKLDATVKNIDKAFVKSARVAIASKVGIMTTYNWYDAEITLGDTEHTISWYLREPYVYLSVGMLVELTYYSLIGGANKLTVEAVWTE